MRALSIPVFYSWGRTTKKLADIGLQRCQFCGQFSGFEIHEVRKQIKLYWVQLLKWNVRAFLRCDKCDRAIEIEPHEAREIVRGFRGYPSNDFWHMYWGLFQRRQMWSPDVDRSSQDQALEEGLEWLRLQVVRDGFHPNVAQGIGSVFSDQIRLIREKGSWF